MIKKSFWRSSLLVCCVGVCSTATAQNQSDAKKTIEQKVEDLRASLEFHKILIDSIETRTGDSGHSLDCATNHYAPIIAKGTTLTFLVSCARVEPYLEGYRITLSIANPYAMKFDGVTGQLGYGENDYKAFTQAAPLNTPLALLPGVWNATTVTLNQISAKDVRVIRINEIELTSATGSAR